jgi:hypothetical protein
MTRRSNLGFKSRDVPILQPWFEEAAIEVAVVADGRAERDVEVKP